MSEKKQTKSIKEKIVLISNELRLSKEGKNDFQKYNYFRPDDIAKAINPLMEKYGLIAMFNLPFNREKAMYEGSLTIESINSEEKVEYRFDIPLTKVQGTSEAQGAGATMTYCKRYMLMNIFNIADDSSDLDSMDTKTPLSKKIAKEAEESDDICEKCRKGKRIHRTGVKKGKKWEGWFCQNPECKDVAWGPKVDEDKDQSDIDDLEEEKYKGSISEDDKKAFGEEINEEEIHS